MKLYTGQSDLKRLRFGRNPAILFRQCHLFNLISIVTLLCPSVLQPAVEAFFLVHATERESKPPVRDTRESQLSHIKDEPPPLTPAPLTPATPSSLDPFFSREPSSMHISSNLPPDTQKFLRFAGEPEWTLCTHRFRVCCMALC